MPQDLLTEQIRILFKNLPITLGGAVSVSVALTAMLWNTVAHAPLLGWLAVNLAMMAWRFGSYLRFDAAALDPALARRLARGTIIYSTLYGLVWAWLPLYYFGPDDLLIISNISLFAVGMVAGALVTQSAYLPSLYGFMLPFAVASGGAMFWKGGPFAELGYFAVVYAVIAVVFGQRVNAVFLEVIETRFANEDLVAALREEKAQAEEASVAKSRFLASASHDVRQPLHAMSLYLGMLKDDPGNPAILIRISESLTTLESLYGRILEVSRLDAGAVDVLMRPVNISELCRACVRENRSAAAGAGLALTANPVADEAPADVWGLSDPGLLARVLDNLVSNAIRYTESGEVIVGVACEGDNVVLTVVDTGVGIAPEHQAQIYDEYFQVGNEARRRNAGMGLGLSIVRRLCDLLGHRLELVSHVGVGSRFSVTLPLAEPSSTDITELQQAFSVDGAAVVLIDDDAQVREATRLQLEQWGCGVQALADASELASVAVRPDVVIADYRLPGAVTGVQAVARLSERFGSELPGIIVTGDTAPDVLAELESSGLTVLHKPVPSAVLNQAVSATLRSALAADGG